MRRIAPLATITETHADLEPSTSRPEEASLTETVTGGHA